MAAGARLRSGGSFRIDHSLHPAAGVKPPALGSRRIPIPNRGRRFGSSRAGAGGNTGYSAGAIPDFSYSRRAADRGILQPVDSARVPRAAGTPSDWTTCRLGAPASGRHRSAPAERNRISLLLPDGACTRHALLLWWQRAFRFASLRDAGWKPALRGPDGDSPDGSDTASTGASDMRNTGYPFDLDVAGAPHCLGHVVGGL